MSAFYDLNKTPRNILNQAIVRAIISENNGAWFDPSDLSTLFQDAAGTTPVTAMEQPVGLWLDKSQGLELGPELVTNGDFSHGISNWYDIQGSGITGNATASNGDVTLQITNSTTVNDISIKQDKNFGSNAIKITAHVSTVIGLVKANFRIRYYNGTSYLFKYSGDITTASGGELSAVLSPPIGGYYADQVMFALFPTAVGSIGSAVFSDISVREIKGNHATQSITASRPVISARKNLLLATDTLSTQSVTTVAAQQTLSFTGAGTVTLSGASTAGPLVGAGANNRVSLTFTPTAGTLTLTISGSVTLAQLEYGPAATRYQRVNTATDYDSVGFDRFIKFDRVDDYFDLPFIGLYSNGATSIIAALSNLTSTGGESLVSEGNSSSNAQIYLPMTKINGSSFGAYIRNDSHSEVLYHLPVDSYTSPALVKSHVDAGNMLKTYRNGVGLAEIPYARSGTLTNNIATLGCGKQVGTFNFFSGRLYGLLITKSALSDADRRKCEVYLGRKAGVQL